MKQIKTDDLCLILQHMDKRIGIEELNDILEAYGDDYEVVPGKNHIQCVHKNLAICGLRALEKQYKKNARTIIDYDTRQVGEGE